MIAAAAALFVGAAGFALFLWLSPLIGDAGAAAATAAASLVFLLLVFLIATYRREPKHEHHPEPPSQAHSLISMFSETIKERPILTMGLTALTGLAATRDPNLLKDLWVAVLHHHRDET